MVSNTLTKQQRLDQIRGHLLHKFQLPSEQIEQMLPEFVNALISHVANLERALIAGDLMALGRAAHTIKGALLNLGLDDCVELAREIEVEGKALNSETDFTQLVGQLRQQLGELIE